jgi:hypothetical protein
MREKGTKYFPKKRYLAGRHLWRNKNNRHRNPSSKINRFWRKTRQERAVRNY